TRGGRAAAFRGARCPRLTCTRSCGSETSACGMASGAHPNPDPRPPPMNLLTRWIRDLRHAARTLLRTPAFTTVVVGTLALAIGANTAIFSVVETVLLDPLGFPEADRLVALRGVAPGTDLPEGGFGLGGEFLVEYRENATLLEDIAFYGLSQT